MFNDHQITKSHSDCFSPCACLMTYHFQHTHGIFQSLFPYGNAQHIPTTIPGALNLPLSTLVPNHLSTVKNYQSTTSISYPYSSLFTTFHPSSPATQQKPHQKWRGSEKESGGEKEKGVEMRMRRKKEVQRRLERCISTPIPNHLSTSLSPPMPNHLST